MSASYELIGLESHDGRFVSSFCDLAALKAFRYLSCNYQDGICAVPRKLLMLLYLYYDIINY